MLIVFYCSSGIHIVYFCNETWDKTIQSDRMNVWLFKHASIGSLPSTQGFELSFYFIPIFGAKSHNNGEKKNII